MCRAGGRGRLGRRAGHGGNRHDIARVPALHRIDRVGHRDMHHGQGARPRIARDARNLHDFDRGLVPVGDGIGVDEGGYKRPQRATQGER